ncbi:unnamed protein product [Rotaria socialis]|uniref:Uncharacterized protein n=1 Tax=Rotaria socialis TaxID=392032 RepID=A0A817P1Q4_9BILA|nr:unnamed protein product [Rotaria socialis]
MPRVAECYTLDGVSVSSTFDADDNMSDDLDDCPNPEANKKSKSINTIAFQNVQSNMTEEINIPPVTPTQTTASRDLHSVSTCTNTKIHILFVERSGSFIGADDEDNRALNNRLPLTQNPIEYDENQLSLTMNHATSHVANTSRNHELLKSRNNLLSRSNADKNTNLCVSKSTITLSTPNVGDNRTNCNLSQCTNSFNIDRSIIRLSDLSNNSRENRPTNTPIHIRTVDILSSIEYRELERKNRDLSNKNGVLKEALKKVQKERKKMETTHMSGELGLNPLILQQVQREADKADKVAMSIWRKLCPTRADQLYVNSIKNVPTSTLQNIYTLARLSFPKGNLNYKKMRNDIAASLRQGHFNSKGTTNTSFIDSETQQNDQSDDEHEIVVSGETSAHSKSSFQARNSIDHIIDDDDEEELKHEWDYMENIDQM